MVTMKLLVSLMVLVTVAKADEGVAKEDMNGFMCDVSREMRIVKETMATMAAKVDMLETEVMSIKQICRVQNFSCSVCRVFLALGIAAIVLFAVIGTKMWKPGKLLINTE